MACNALRVVVSRMHIPHAILDMVSDGVIKSERYVKGVFGVCSVLFLLVTSFNAHYPWCVTSNFDIDEEMLCHSANGVQMRYPCGHAKI